MRITDDAAVRLAKEFGTFTGELEGHLAPFGQDSLAVSIEIGRAYRGTALQNVRQTFPVGRAEVLDIRRRELSRGRTILAGAGAAAVFVVLVRSIVQQEDPNIPDDREPPPPPPGNGFRIPLRLW